MTDFVPGEGPEHARVMLVGQNPGEEEGRVGHPFVGAAGRYLDGVLFRHGLLRRELYITNAVKETTPRDRKPTAVELRRWLPELAAEIDRVKPEIIVLMGEAAHKAPRRVGIRYIETCHPAAAMRFPRYGREFERAFEKLATKLRAKGDPGPPSGHLA